MSMTCRVLGVPRFSFYARGDAGVADPLLASD